ncbi:MAG: hypothetical protein IJH95_01500 [Mogibacterium sp.]|nr:hypothetical protein [Mogibacterium sp.]
MPLILLGLILILGIIIYSIIRYMNSEDDDPRSVRERYPHAFPPKKDIFKGADRWADRGPDEESDIKHTEDGNIIFPTDNLENEKHKRNIH